jgi:uncharacterized alkaline shock family protein YloU
MTGFLVKSCNVNVQGIHALDPDKKRPEAVHIAKSRS